MSPLSVKICTLIRISLVWAEIPKPAVLSVVPLTKLLAAMPTMPGDGDPFGVELVHKAKYMSEARTPIYQDPLPMSFQYVYFEFFLLL